MTERDAVNRALAERRLALRQAAQERSKLAEAVRGRLDAQEASQAAQEAAKLAQTQAVARIASLATRCLAAVFPESPYELRVNFEKRRGRTEAELSFARGGLDLGDPADQAGGACVEVAAFALRLACLLFSAPARRRLLVLDEPFKALSKGRMPAARALLEGLAEEAGVQILMVTHERRLVCGSVIEL